VFGARTGFNLHRIRTFKFSNDPQFAAKVRDIVGLDDRTRRPMP
jgi:hypothetical protein